MPIKAKKRTTGEDDPLKTLRLCVARIAFRSTGGIVVAYIPSGQCGEDNGKSVYPVYPVDRCFIKISSTLLLDHLTNILTCLSLHSL